MGEGTSDHGCPLDACCPLGWSSWSGLGSSLVNRTWSRLSSWFFCSGLVSSELSAPLDPDRHTQGHLDPMQATLGSATWGLPGAGVPASRDWETWPPVDLLLTLTFPSACAGSDPTSSAIGPWGPPYPRMLPRAMFPLPSFTQRALQPASQPYLSLTSFPKSTLREGRTV